MRLSYYLSLIYLLGQSDELLKLTRLPRTDDEKQSVITAIKNSAMKVRALRNAFDQLISMTTAVNPEALQKIAPIHRASFTRLRSINDPADGLPMLHVLSPVVTETAPQFREFRAPAEAWIHRELRRFQDLGDAKLMRLAMPRTRLGSLLHGWARIRREYSRPNEAS